MSHPYENLVHPLYEFPDIQIFWQRLISWWNETRSENVILSALDTLYGYNVTISALDTLYGYNVTLSALDILYGNKPESNIFQALDHYVIIAKYHIFFSWFNKTSPSFEIFCVLLNEKILCERTFAFKNNTLRKFRAKWVTLHVCA